MSEKVTLQHATINNVPALPDLSDPLMVRCAQAENSKELNELLGRAYPDEDWQLESTERELFHDKTVQTVLMVIAENKILATASLQIRSDAQEVGWVRWVATELEHRRQGFAQTLVVKLLAQAAARQCRVVRLNTTTDQLGAIAMYLKLGFEPLVTNQKEQDVWDRVSLSLNDGAR